MYNLQSLARTIKPSYFFVLVVFCAAFFSNSSFAKNDNIGETVVNKIHFLPNNILEISLTKKSEFKVFTLSNPERLVVDVKKASFNNTNEKVLLPPFVTKVRTRIDQDNLRIVFDLNQHIVLERNSFQKVKNQNFGKIVIKFSGVKTVVTPAAQDDNILSEKANADFNITSKKTVNPDGSIKYVIIKTPKNTANIEKKTTYQITKKIPVIVIDSGHGGKDPGTVGNYARTKEKNITLSYAKELKKYLDNTKRYKTYLTRDDDYFIPLRKRVEKARRLKADLFISLHVNWIDDTQTSGLSIYTLSEKSSDKQAELLAQKENRSDILAGINFAGASQDIMKTLIDLSQRDCMNNSSNFANIVINSARKSKIKVLQNTHRFAGFAVLTAPDMASTLIELGYISNRQEENQLNSLSYKRQVTQSLTNAIDEYFSQIKH